MDKVKKRIYKDIFFSVIWGILFIVGFWALAIQFLKGKDSFFDFFQVATNVFVVLYFLKLFLLSIKPLDNLLFRYKTKMIPLSFSCQTVVETGYSIEFEKYMNIKFDKMVIDKCYRQNQFQISYRLISNDYDLPLISFTIDFESTVKLNVVFQTIDGMKRHRIKKILNMYKNIVAQIEKINSVKSSLYSIRIAYTNSPNPYVKHLLKAGNGLYANIVLENNVIIDNKNFEINGFSFDDLIQKIDKNVFIR